MKPDAHVIDQLVERVVALVDPLPKRIFSSCLSSAQSAQSVSSAIRLYHRLRKAKRGVSRMFLQAAWTVKWAKNRMSPHLGCNSTGSPMAT